MEYNTSRLSIASLYASDRSDEELQTALDSDFLNQVRTVVKGIKETSDVVGYENNQVTSRMH